MADNQLLAAWLRDRTERAKPPIIKAVYEGLRMRVERGDFDERFSTVSDPTERERVMSVAKDIMTDLVDEISFADLVHQVDAEPQQGEDGGWYLDIDTDDGDTYRLTLSLIPEQSTDRNRAIRRSTATRMRAGAVLLARRLCRVPNRQNRSRLTDTRPAMSAGSTMIVHHWGKGPGNVEHGMACRDRGVPVA